MHTPEIVLAPAYADMTVIESKSKLKRWGNFGVLIPKEIVEKEGLWEGAVVQVSVSKTSDIRHLFGKYHLGSAKNKRKK